MAPPWRTLSLALGALTAALLSPPRCSACDDALDSPRALCPRCARTLVEAAPEADGVVAPFAYGGALADAIRRFKYGDRPDLARALAHVALRGRRDAWPVDLVVPIPLHDRRLAERGYNHAALLSATIASHLGVPHAPRGLARVAHRRPQVECSRTERLANARGLFVARRPLPPVSVLLVDDVCTTGATLEDATRALREGGACRVERLVIARG